MIAATVTETATADALDHRIIVDTVEEMTAMHTRQAATTVTESARTDIHQRATVEAIGTGTVTVAPTAEMLDVTTMTDPADEIETPTMTADGEAESGTGVMMPS
jgi:hypothetical protein